LVRALAMMSSSAWCVPKKQCSPASTTTNNALGGEFWQHHQKIFEIQEEQEQKRHHRQHLPSRRCEFLYLWSITVTLGFQWLCVIALEGLLLKLVDALVLIGASTRGSGKELWLLLVQRHLPTSLPTNNDSEKWEWIAMMIKKGGTGYIFAASPTIILRSNYFTVSIITSSL
jgi:hypothetical protein